MLDADYFKKKVQQLDLGRAETLTKIQTELDKMYPDQARAISLNGGILKIITPNASVAQDLRLRQVELLAGWNRAGSPITRLQIQIRSL